VFLTLQKSFPGGILESFRIADIGLGCFNGDRVSGFEIMPK
jgi:hypothetical protein